MRQQEYRGSALTVLYQGSPGSKAERMSLSDIFTLHRVAVEGPVRGKGGPLWDAALPIQSRGLSGCRKG
jgi:hypothetical protein